MEMDVLKVKHWQWVVLLFILIIPVDLARIFIGRLFRVAWIDVPLESLVGALYIAYPLLIWNRLNKILAGEPLFERTAPRAAIPIALVFILAPMFTDLEPNETLRTILAGVFLSCFIFIGSLPAKQLKSIELKRNAGVWEYAPDTFNFLFWPLGVFWIQSRMNRLPEKRIVINE